MRATAIAAALLCASAGRSAGAAEPLPKPPLTLILNGVVRLAQDFDESRTVDLFREKGSIETSYHASPGPGGEIGLQYPLGPRLGILATAGVAIRNGGGAYTARLPHPLYLNAHRVSEGTIDGLSYTELAGHVGLVLVGRVGTLGYTLFGGPSVYRVEAELVDRAQTQEVYPYDEVTFTLTTTKVNAFAPGLHAGGSLAYPISPRLAFGLQTRYGYGRVALAPNDEDETRVTGGGLQLALGLRWSF